MNRTPRFGDSPFHRALGIEPLARDARVAEVRLPPRADFLQETGVVQGGLLAALADACGVHLLLPELDAGQSLTSIEFKVNFLRPARLEAGALLARAELVRRGRRVAVCRASVLQAGEAVLEGLFTYLVSASDAPSAS